MLDDKLKMQEVLDELQSETTNPELIQDNKLHFTQDNVLYRVQMPTQKEIAEATTKRNQKQIYLMKQPDTLSEKALRKLLKEHDNLDIDVLEASIKELEGKMTDLFLSLAKLKDNEITAIENIKFELNEVKNKRWKLIEEKIEALSPSIQNQSQTEYFKYLTFSTTERYEEVKNDKNETVGNWIKQWSTYEDYETDRLKLPYVALGRLMELMLNG